MNKSNTVISRKKRGPAATGKGEPVLTRLQPEILLPLDALIGESKEALSRPEAIRRILVEHFTEDEDAAINAIYKSGEPGIGAKFMKAIIGHLRTHVRQNPDITVDQCKEFVLDLFNNYDQDLGEYLEVEKKRLAGGDKLRNG